MRILPGIIVILLSFAGCATTGPSRNLASLQSGEAIDFDTSVYADLLSQDTGKKRLKYKMDFRFSTDIKEDYLRAKARAAFQTAIAKTLDTSNPQNQDKALGARFKDQIISAIISEFIKTLSVVKIINGTIQVDLTFLPEMDDPGSFAPEFANNGLVRWNELGGTLQALNAFERPSDVDRLVKIAGHPVIQEQLNDSRYAYVGGSITLWLKLADMDYDFSHPIPNPAKNAVKGTVRFRRIFTAPTMSFTNVSCKDTSMEKLEFQPVKEPDSRYQFVTVDHIKAFNLKRLVPVDESLEIYFGHLLPNHKGRKGLLAAEDYSEEPRKTGELSAVLKETQYTKIKHRIGTLTYNFSDEAFDLKNSVIKSSVVDSHAGEGYPDTYGSQKSLLNDCKAVLMEQLGLARFLKEGGN